MPTPEIPPRWDHVDLTFLQQSIEMWKEKMAARKDGLQRLPVNLVSDENILDDNTLAKNLRTTFRHEILEPLLSPNADKSVHNTNADPNYHGTSGYLIGIDAFLDMYQAFRNCEAVQICFGMDRPLDEGGQLQLVFRGYQNSAPAEAVFVTPQPLNIEPGPFGGNPINPPRICPAATISC